MREKYQGQVSVIQKGWPIVLFVDRERAGPQVCFTPKHNASCQTTGIFIDTRGEIITMYCPTCHEGNVLCDLSWYPKAGLDPVMTKWVCINPVRKCPDFYVVKSYWHMKRYNQNLARLKEKSMV
jgi:hypothetical protein